MSEPYLIEGVTITPQGGGFYELTHPRLSEPLKERGKEHAEAKAKEIAASFAAVPESDEGASMTPQGDVELVGLGQPVDPALVPPAPGPGSPDPAVDTKIASLEADNAEIKAKLDAVLAMITKTVVTDGGAVPPSPSSAIPGAVPRRFDGTASEESIRQMEKLGIEYSVIILEENETIPPTGLFLGHNGRGYMIVPGEPVPVPNFLIDVLDNAVMSAPVVDNKSQKILGYRERLKHPYRRV